jgi:hypothetical protein
MTRLQAISAQVKSSSGIQGSFYKNIISGFSGSRKRRVRVLKTKTGTPLSLRFKSALKPRVS